VLPEIASRLHSEKIIAILQNIGRNKVQEVDFISITTSPGLPGSLIVGKSVATMLSEYFHKPLVNINHIHGHIFSILLERKIKDLSFPMVILTASGGHNDIYLITTTPFKKEKNKMESSQLANFHIYKIGYTLDDAAGEAFDKVSKMLNGPYPGGPRISQQAIKGKSNHNYHFKRIFLPQDEQDNFVFSFSGMKSQVSILLNKLKKAEKKLTEQDIADIAYEFQEATIETLANRLRKATKEYGAKTIAVAGGVSANNRLIEYVENIVQEHNNQEYIKEHDLKILFLSPTKKVYSTDNAAMIGVAGILQYKPLNV
jgi:N6-L-threonylcarbamoyladenine synthase